MKPEDIIDQIKEAAIGGEDVGAAELTEKALGKGIDPYKIISDALNPGMNEVAIRYEKREISLAEVIISIDAFQTSLDVLKPVMKREIKKPLGRVVIGTVKDDVHDLGKELVKTMLGVAGFECYDLGHDVPVSTFLEKAIEVDADIIAASALMATTMTVQKEIIDALKDADIRDKVKVIVGGAPVSPEWADTIGADGYGKDALEAAEVAKKLMRK